MNTKIIDEVHFEFNIAVNELKQLSKKQPINPDCVRLSSNIYENGLFLDSIGFKNIKSAVEAKKQTEIISNNGSNNKNLILNSEQIRKSINRYNKSFPSNKFILYYQVLNILKKYNLFLGHSNIFNGNMPQKNILEIKDFCKIEGSNSDITGVDIESPLCMHNGSMLNQYHAIPNFYICAPKSNFLLNNTVIIGNEIVMNNSFTKTKLTEKLKYSNELQNPIILAPVPTTIGTVGFIIVTKCYEKTT